MKDKVQTGRGLWATIQDTQPITYSSESQLDYNEIFKELMSQPPQEHTLLVGGLTHKFITAYDTNDESLLKEAQGELAEKVYQEHVRLSKLTGMSIENIKNLSEKYYKDIYDRWNIDSTFIGDEGNEYDDRHEYTYLKFEDGKWSIEVEWTDGWEYKITSETFIDKRDVVRKFLSK